MRGRRLSMESILRNAFKYKKRGGGISELSAAITHSDAIEMDTGTERQCDRTFIGNGDGKWNRRNSELIPIG